MNEFFPNLSYQVLLAFPGFRLYALCVLVLFLKMFAMTLYTSRTRSRLKVALNAEDAARFGAQLVATEHPEVERVLRAHRNDVENIPLFFTLGLIAVLAGVPVLGLRICFIAFTAARVAHSLVYIKALQPWRSVSFAIGSMSLGALSVMIFIRLVS
jgi:prostaglandin-E synthase 1